MRKNFTKIMALLLLVMATPVVAQSNKVVVELYTSQGCSSCPPADEVLTKLATRDDVIALALHVDYWDYIGWKDIFGSPAYSDRQRSYARARGSRTVYTPQMIIGGVADIVGHRGMEVVDEIAQQRGVDKGISLKLSRQGGTVSIVGTSTRGRSKAMLVQLVRYVPSESVTITRGENAGRTIVYTNIVTEWRQIEKWDGRAPLNMSVDISGDEPLVVIVQEPGPGAILAAVQLE